MIIEATGDPEAGIRHALAAIAHGKHIVMVNVEADALAGPLLARKAKAAGVVYSLAWGDQPALICEQVDWARACGFKVIAAGKGTRYQPSYHRSTPDTVWDILDKYLQHRGPRLDQSEDVQFLHRRHQVRHRDDGGVQRTGLVPQSDGLGFPAGEPVRTRRHLQARAEGGTLEKAGVTEVVSSVYRDGRDVPHHLAMGTFVVFEGESDYARRCFREYHLMPDASGRYAALYRPIHMIGLELGISVAIGGVARRADRRADRLSFRRGRDRQARSQGRARCSTARAASASGASRRPAARSLEPGLLPLGLAQQVKLKRDVAEGEMLRGPMSNMIRTTLR